MDEPPSPAPAFPFSLRWIAADDYERLFREFRLSAVDPEILLVGGILRASGQVEWARSYRLPQGIIDRAPAGPMSLRVLDASGGILYRLAFGRDTRTAGPSGDIPFAFAVPFAPGAETVELTMDSVVRGDFRIASRLLRDVVSAIPDYGFDRNPSQRRGVLLNKIDVLETQLKAGARQGARDKLRNDIRKHLAEWLVDDYTTDSPLKYEKAAVLKLVDELIQRLGG